MQTFFMTADTTVFRLVNRDWQTSWLDPAMTAFSCTPILWGILAAAVLFLVRRCFRKTAGNREGRKKRLRRILASCLLLACTTGATEAATVFTKNSMGRLRPYQELAGTRYVAKGQWVLRNASAPVTAKRGNSFISGHASNSMAVATTIAALCPALRPVIFTLPACVGYSRVYLGRHYPSDVLGGWFIGWLISTCMCRAYTRHARTGRAPAIERKLANA